MGELKMYRVDDDGEHHSAIAESEPDALKVLVESGISNASSVDEYVRDYKPTLRERPVGESVTLIDDDGKRITKTAGEWVAEEGAAAVLLGRAGVRVDGRDGGELLETLWRQGRAVGRRGAARRVDQDPPHWPPSVGGTTFGLGSIAIAWTCELQT